LDVEHIVLEWMYCIKIEFCRLTKQHMQAQHDDDFHRIPFPLRKWQRPLKKHMNQEKILEFNVSIALRFLCVPI